MSSTTGSIKSKRLHHAYGTINVLNPARAPNRVHFPAAPPTESLDLAAAAPPRAQRSQGASALGLHRKHRESPQPVVGRHQRRRLPLVRRLRGLLSRPPEERTLARVHLVRLGRFLVLRHVPPQRQDARTQLRRRGAGTRRAVRHNLTGARHRQQQRVFYRIQPLQGGLTAMGRHEQGRHVDAGHRARLRQRGLRVGRRRRGRALLDLQRHRELRGRTSPHL